MGWENGDLLKFLNKGKQIDGRGLEISQKNVNICVNHGLSVVQGDADKYLIAYPSKSFDFVDFILWSAVLFCAVLTTS